MSHPRQQRRSVRLAGYDYRTEAAYFLTLCTHGREPLLGTVTENRVELSAEGHILDACWRRLPVTFGLRLDAWVIMPNHVHGIIVLAATAAQTGEASARGGGAERDVVRADASPLLAPRGTAPGSVGAVVQNLKSVSARRINQRRGSPGAPVWQRNYYEHIIGSEQEWDRIRGYIDENPWHWSEDPENPHA